MAAMMTLSPAMLARPTAGASRSRTTARAAAPQKKSITDKSVKMPTVTSVVKAVKGAGAVLGGVAAAGLVQALVPESAMAISITDPVGLCKLNAELERAWFPTLEPEMCFPAFQDLLSNATCAGYNPVFGDIQVGLCTLNQVDP